MPHLGPVTTLATLRGHMPNPVFWEAGPVMRRELFVGLVGRTKNSPKGGRRSQNTCPSYSVSLVHALIVAACLLTAVLRWPYLSRDSYRLYFLCRLLLPAWFLPPSYSKVCSTHLHFLFGFLSANVSYCCHYCHFQSYGSFMTGFGCSRLCSVLVLHCSLESYSLDVDLLLRGQHWLLVSWEIRKPKDRACSESSICPLVTWKCSAQSLATCSRWVSSNHGRSPGPTSSAPFGIGDQKM